MRRNWFSLVNVVLIMSKYTFYKFPEFWRLKRLPSTSSADDERFDLQICDVLGHSFSDGAAPQAYCVRKSNARSRVQANSKTTPRTRDVKNIKIYVAGEFCTYRVVRRETLFIVCRLLQGTENISKLLQDVLLTFSTISVTSSCSRGDAFS